MVCTVSMIIKRRLSCSSRPTTRSLSCAAREVINSLRRRAGSLSSNQLYLGVAEVVALADNGHSNVAYGDGAETPRTILPIRFAIAGGSVFVVRAQQDFVGLLGAEVASIEGVPTNEFLARLAKYFGGGSVIGRRTRALACS